MNTEVLSARNLYKSSDSYTDISGVSIDIKPGHIHAVLGQSGSGKATLLKALGGAERVNSGAFYIGEKHISLGSITNARKHGIAISFANPMLPPHFSLAQTLALSLPSKNLRIDKAEAADRIETYNEICGFDLDPYVPNIRLSYRDRQIAEIIRVLALMPAFAILIDPVVTLNHTDSLRVYKAMRYLASQGGAVLFSTPRQSVALEAADEISVIRGGDKIGTYSADEYKEQDQSRLLFGNHKAHTYRRSIFLSGDMRFYVSDIATGDKTSASFDAQGGDIVGIAGIINSGRQYLLSSLFGIGDKSGEVRINGIPIIRSSNASAKAGIAYAACAGSSLAGNMSSSENITISSLEAITKGLFISRKRELALAKEASDVIGINDRERTAVEFGSRPDTIRRTTIARAIASNARVLLLDDPFSDIPQSAKEDLMQRLRNFAENGGLVIFTSPDISHFIQICDKVIVLRNGSVFTTLRGNEVNDADVSCAVYEYEESDGEAINEPSGEVIP